MVRTLREMIAEVHAVNQANGWYDKLVTFGEAMALVHSEVSEALEAWRRWGFEDRTNYVLTPVDQELGIVPKPEGVGSEFADVLIRWLHYSELFSIEIEGHRHAYIKLSEDFPSNLNLLHMRIARVSELNDTSDDISEAWTNVLSLLEQLSLEYDINLPVEYERKLAYNRTRPYRHGGKLV